MKQKLFFTLAFAFVIAVKAQAQMSYQVSLLNTATGEPRANVTVSATTTLSNSHGETIYSSTQNATTNDFGVLQLIVGNKDTFNNIDTGKLPLYISVSVDGTQIGKTQIMTVPVSEVATTLKSSFTLENLTGRKWTCKNPYEYDVEYTLEFYADGSCTLEIGYEVPAAFGGKYEVEGNNIYCLFDLNTRNDFTVHRVFRWSNGMLYDLSGHPNVYK